MTPVHSSSASTIFLRFGGGDLESEVVFAMMLTNLFEAKSSAGAASGALNKMTASDARNSAHANLLVINRL